jgi:hypothetical protein
MLVFRDDRQVFMVVPLAFDKRSRTWHSGITTNAGPNPNSRIGLSKTVNYGSIFAKSLSNTGRLNRSLAG